MTRLDHSDERKVRGPGYVLRLLMMLMVAAGVPFPPNREARAANEVTTAPVAEKHSFQLRRILPDADTTTPVDEFPDPAHPGHKLRLSRTVLIDESVLTSATTNDGILIQITGAGSVALSTARQKIAPEPWRAAAVIDGELLPPGELTFQFSPPYQVYIATGMNKMDRAVVAKFAGILNELALARPGVVVHGQVLDKPGGKGVPNVPVTIALAMDQPRLTTRTGEDGSFEFKNIPPAGQQYFFDFDGETRGGDRSVLYVDQGDVGTTKTVKLYQQLQSISGRVLDSKTHEPVANAQIRAGWNGGGLMEASTFSDAAGRYRLYVIPRSVLITSEGSATHLPMNIQPKKVEVQEGRNLENVDIELEMAPRIDFDVQVVDGDGKPVANAVVKGEVSMVSEGAGSYLEMSPPAVAMAAPATDAAGLVHATMVFGGQRGKQNFQEMIHVELSARNSDDTFSGVLTLQFAPRNFPTKPLEVRLAPGKVEENIFRFVAPNQ